MSERKDTVQNLDFSQLTYDEWLTFFFDKPVDQDVFWKEYERFDSFITTDPAKVVGYLEMLSVKHRDICESYSRDQVEQGLWAIFSVFSLHRYLFEVEVDVRSRERCIESMCSLFADAVIPLDLDVRHGFYWMWWDYILHELWLPGNGDHQLTSLRPDLLQLLDATVRTLSAILILRHRGCQWAALHGLGHTHHPQAPRMVQRYLEEHDSELTEEDRAWVRACRDGVVQ